jgi:hypothetical protein
MFQIETRKPDDKLLSEWTSDIGDANKFATQQDAWTQIGELKKLGDEWASAEYRVVEVEL